MSPVLFYDPVGRVAATLHPNHTWEKVVFDPWRQETWDVNDTVSITDPKDDPDVNDYFRRLPDTEYLPGWHAQRAGGAMGTEEQTAAIKAAVHAATPSVAHMDSLGRAFLSVAHNKLKRSDAPPDDPPTEAFHSTRVVYDIEGNQRDVIDALDRIVMRYDYDMLGGQVNSDSMEAGERWMLNDVAGKPLYGWNSRDHRLRTVYDQLRRPAEVYLQEGGGPERLVGRTVYGESQLNPEASNLRGKPYQSFDGAGVVTTDDYDFKGNLLSSSRQLAVDYKNTLDWSAAVALEAEIFAAGTTYDALNRPVTLTTPDQSVILPRYNEANLLERVEAKLRGSMTATVFVRDLDYNAKGQRERIEYGNGVITTYQYDPLTFRLTHLRTLRGSEPLQDLSYTYDPAGNITHIRDEAQQTIYFRNTRVEPGDDYTYDAIYQLTEATGREHLGQNDNQPNPPTAPDAFNFFHSGQDQPGDRNAMGLYRESYVYDAVGNIRLMQHRGTDPSHPGWTRDYAYNEDSLIEIESAKTSNRLSSTRIGNGELEPYTYDAHGNMTTMSHLSLMRWNYRDQLEATSRQAVGSGTPETTYYVYDGGGQRVRKVTERQAGPDKISTRMNERIYLGGFEIYREYSAGGSTVSLERETLHLMDGQQRVALVETRTQGDDGTAAQLIRYQLGNHLGSASLELNETGAIISYEEYYSYGSTSYQATDANIKAAAKRYRYTGMERDEETGLNYHGARYYAPWLGRWASIDQEKSPNRYAYVNNRPIVMFDPDGRVAQLVVVALVVIGGVSVSSVAWAPEPGMEEKIKAEDPSGLEETAAIAGGMATGYAVGALLVVGATGGVFLYGLGGRGALNAVASRLGTLQGLMQTGRAGASTLWQLAREQGFEFLGSGILNRIQPGLGDLVFSVGLPQHPEMAGRASKAVAEGDVLSNILRNEPAENVLGNFDVGTGFTGVHNRETGEFLLIPSGRHSGATEEAVGSGTLDLSEEPRLLLDEGAMYLPTDSYLPRQRGHKGVLIELAEQTDVTGAQGLSGFSITKTPEGEPLNFQWLSGNVNFPNFGSRELPAEMREEIIRAVSEATARPLPD